MPGPRSSSKAQRRRLIAAAAGLMLLLLAGCGGGGDDGASAGGVLESQAEQVAAGREVYTGECAQCHGPNGEGGTGPLVIGGGKRIATYASTERLYDYISRTMPFDTPGSLTPDQYWNVIAYLLEENDLLPQDTVLGPDSESIELKRG